MQHAFGRHLSHERVQSTTLWAEQGVLRMFNMKGVIETMGHMCRFDITQKDARDETSMFKPTTFMTNPVCTTDEVNRLCIGDHRRIRLEGRKSKEAQIYLVRLYETMCKRFAIQKRMDVVWVACHYGFVGK